MRINNSENIKNAFNRINAPDNMKDVLLSALSDKHRLNGNKSYHILFRHRAAIIAATVLMALLIYSFDTMAFYIKKISNYDGIIEGSLKTLNDEGQGQIIEKSCTFSNGDSLSIDKIFFDDNQLVVLYTFSLSQPAESPTIPQIALEGLSSSPHQYPGEGGMASQVDSNTLVGMSFIKPPAFYEKWMSFKISHRVNGVYEEKAVPFTLIRNQAMFKTINQNLRKQVTINDSTIFFDSISASPLSTMIKGNIEGFDEEYNGDLGLRPIKRLCFDVEADGNKTLRAYSSLSDKNGAVTFESTFDALPQEFSNLMINNIRYETIKITDKTLDIATSESAVNEQLDKDITITEIREEGNSLYLTVECAGIPIIGVLTDGNELKCINKEDFESPDNYRLKVKTFEFEGTGNNYTLMVKGIKYIEWSDTDLIIE